jgi:hypothetical protein
MRPAATYTVTVPKTPAVPADSALYSGIPDGLAAPRRWIYAFARAVCPDVPKMRTSAFRGEFQLRADLIASILFAWREADDVDRRDRESDVIGRPWAYDKKLQAEKILGVTAATDVVKAAFASGAIRPESTGWAAGYKQRVVLATRAVEETYPKTLRDLERPSTWKEAGPIFGAVAAAAVTMGVGGAVIGGVAGGLMSAASAAASLASKVAAQEKAVDAKRKAEDAAVAKAAAAQKAAENAPRALPPVEDMIPWALLAGAALLLV